MAIEQVLRASAVIRNGRGLNVDAQLVVQRVEEASFVPVANLPDSVRGLGGFGHTGR